MARTEADRLILARLSGIVTRRVGFRELTVEERTEAVAEIRTVTTRPDLLAQEAGILLGVAPSRLIPPEIERTERMARLLIEAGADEALIPSWAEIGRGESRTPGPSRTRERDSDPTMAKPRPDSAGRGLATLEGLGEDPVRPVPGPRVLVRQDHAEDPANGDDDDPD